MKTAAVILVLASMLLPGAALAVDCQQGGAFCNISGTKIFTPSFFNSGGPAGVGSFGELVILVLNILMMIVGSVATLFLIVGALRYLTAAGNEEAAEGAKKMMTNAVVGLVVAIMSFAMIYIITSILILGRAGV